MSYSQCSEMFRLERRTDAPQRPAGWFYHGTAVHDTIEAWEKSGRTLTEEELNLKYLTVYRTLVNDALEEFDNNLGAFMTGGFKKAETDLTDREEIGWYQIRDYTQNALLMQDVWEVIDVEPRFDIVLGGVWLVGYIDQVVRNKVTKEIYPVDLKGLPLDTPLATPTGWTTMGDVGVGDQVLGANGTPVTVTAKSEVKNLDVYRVSFNDGTYVDCDEEHLWEVGAHNTKTKVLPVTDLLGRSPESPYRVRLPKPVDLPSADLLIDPYVLGVWLADGNRNSGAFVKGDGGAIAEEIQRRGYTVTRWADDPRTTAGQYYINDFLTPLREYGLLKNKHVPHDYLRASARQRWELLQGLMDGDGTWNKGRKEAVFYSTDEALADAVYEIALLAGEKPVRHSQATSGFGKGVISYSVTWQPRWLNPFVAKPAAKLVEPGPRRANQHRTIRSVEKIESRPTACISVDAEDCLYLAGRSMVPTHNTGSKTPPAPVQLAIYREALKIMYPHEVVADHAFWVHLGRPPSKTGKTKAKPTKWIEEDLTEWPPERVAVWLQDMDRSESEGIYLPSPTDGCDKVCGVAQYCRAMSWHLESVKQYAPDAMFDPVKVEAGVEPDQQELPIEDAA